MKWGDDLRQEILAAQILEQLKVRSAQKCLAVPNDVAPHDYSPPLPSPLPLPLSQMVWELEQVPMWLRPFKVIVVSAEGGLIEPIPNAISLHQVKKQCSGSLKEYFLKVHSLLGWMDGWMD